MEKIFDYFDNSDFAATVCGKDGTVVYQNAISRQNDGNVVGRNLFKCHSPKTREKIQSMIDTGKNNTYEIIKEGKHFLIHHSPWLDDVSGKVAGLIELSIPLPDTYPLFDRDKKE